MSKSAGKSNKKFINVLGAFTPDQFDFLKLRAEQSGEAVTVHLRALVEKERQASLFLGGNVQKYTNSNGTQKEAA